MMLVISSSSLRGTSRLLKRPESLSAPWIVAISSEASRSNLYPDQALIETVHNIAFDDKEVSIFEGIGTSNGNKDCGSAGMLIVWISSSDWIRSVCGVGGAYLAKRGRELHRRLSKEGVTEA